MDLQARAKSFAMLVPIVCISLLTETTRVLLVGVLGAVCLYEFQTMAMMRQFESMRRKSLLYTYYSGFAIAPSVGWLLSKVQGVVVALFVVLGVLFFEALWSASLVNDLMDNQVEERVDASQPKDSKSTRDLKEVSNRLAVALLGILWIVVPLSAAIVMQGAQFVSPKGNMQSGLWSALYCIVVVVAGENGGLFGGSLIRTLSEARSFQGYLRFILTNLTKSAFPLLSPAKTTGGYLCQLVISAVFSTLFSHWFGSGEELNSTTISFGVGFILGCVGAAGDLFESFVKRSNSCRTTGKILPGWGGLMDRLDGLLFAFPVALNCIVVLFKIRMVI